MFMSHITKRNYFQDVVCVQTSQMGALLHYSVRQYLNLIGTKGQFQNQISIKDEVHNTLWSNLQYYIINHCIIDAYGKNILPSRGKRKTYLQISLTIRTIKHLRAQTKILQSLPIDLLLLISSSPAKIFPNTILKEGQFWFFISIKFYINAKYNFPHK